MGSSKWEELNEILISTKLVAVVDVCTDTQNSDCKNIPMRLGSVCVGGAPDLLHRLLNSD